MKTSHLAAKSIRRHDHLVRLLAAPAFGLVAALFFVGTSTVAAAPPDPADRSAVEARDIANGLFPEGPCEQLRAAGFRCMGIAPPHRYSFASTPFRSGSADLTPALRTQLEAFADALRDRKTSAKPLVIEGHGDTSESVSLAQRRADNVKAYLVDHGVDATLLSTTGVASSDTSGSAPAESRRIEIARVTPPSSASAPSPR